MSRVAVAILVALCAAPVAAQPPPESGSLEKAQDFEKRAREYFAAGDFSASIAELERAYETVPHTNFLFNIAMTYDAWGGHCAEAYDYFERFFDQCGYCKSRKPAEARFHAFMESCGAVVTILAEPAGARVVIDDKARGVAPLEVALLAGNHTVLAELEGYGAASEVFRSEVGKPLTVSLTLDKAARKGHLVLNNLVAGVEVTIDGVVAGSATSELNAGRHTVIIRRDEQPPRVFDVEIVAGATKEIDVGGGAHSTGAPLPHVDEEHTSGRRQLGWIALGIGGVGVVAGGIFAALALDNISAEEDARARHAAPERIDTLRDDARRDALVANAAFIVGLAGLGTGAVLLYMDGEGGDNAGDSARIFAVPGGIGLAGRF